MRILITTLGSPSHGRAQLPLARALAAAGHEVVAATTPPVAPVFERDDVRVVSCIDDVLPGYHVMARLREISEDPALDDEQRQTGLMNAMSESMTGAMAEELLGALLPLARDFRPDVVLRDGMDMGSVLIGELLGVPQLPTPSGSSNSFDPATLLPGLNTLREARGLPVREDPLSIIPYGRIDYVPQDYSFARHLPHSWAYRQTVDVDRGHVLPEWIADLPTDRPLVFAATGTALPLLHEKLGTGAGTDAVRALGMPDPAETLRSIIAAVSRLEECTVIVATMGIPADTGGLPPHVHTAERLPQPLLLESVDLFLTHGGFNSIRESLRTATPMAVLPQFGDQHPNAVRVEELGIGRRVTDTGPDGIAAVCREVLADPGIGARARRARLAMLALPDIESAVADLEKLAG
ncbi:glycosyltransferase [Streptomyces sp. CAU 1734]|uniref:glycosyltransferase n=1 Tax=Streptomyces sp. CAU 1734 TaxID=3140360 RepID=UPI003261038B